MSNDFFVLEAYDSDGKLLIKDGTGDWVYTYEEFNLPQTITVKGSFLNGKKVGDWTCAFSNGESFYKESFKNDILKNGYLTKPDGSKKADYMVKVPFQNKFLPHYKHEIVEKFSRRPSLSRGDYPFFKFLPKPYVIPKDIQYDSLDTRVFIVVEQPPEFVGGLEEMYKFIGMNMKYPASARKARIEGTVFVGFIVEANGSIKEASVIKGIGGDCDAEALRVIMMMPKWRPGIQSGKFVRVKFVLPIKFKLG